MKTFFAAAVILVAVVVYVVKAPLTGVAGVVVAAANDVVDGDVSAVVIAFAVVVLVVKDTVWAVVIPVLMKALIY